MNDRIFIARSDLGYVVIDLEKKVFAPFTWRFLAEKAVTSLREGVDPAKYHWAGLDLLGEWKRWDRDPHEKELTVIEPIRRNYYGIAVENVEVGHWTFTWKGTKYDLKKRGAKRGSPWELWSGKVHLTTKPSISACILVARNGEHAK